MARAPIHPGEHLADELEALAMNAHDFARQNGFPINRITAILNGTCGLTSDMALCLGYFFGTSPEMWLNLQKLYGTRRAEQVLQNTEEPSSKRRLGFMADAIAVPDDSGALGAREIKAMFDPHTDIRVRPEFGTRSKSKRRSPE